MEVKWSLTSNVVSFSVLESFDSPSSEMTPWGLRHTSCCEQIRKSREWTWRHDNVVMVFCWHSLVICSRRVLRSSRRTSVGASSSHDSQASSGTLTSPAAPTVNKCKEKKKQPITWYHSRVLLCHLFGRCPLLLLFWLLFEVMNFTVVVVRLATLALDRHVIGRKCVVARRVRLQRSTRRRH